MKTAGFVLLATLAAQTASPVYDQRLLAWSEGLKKWRRQSDSASWQLSRSVLFDCVAHRRKIDVLFPPSQYALAGDSSCRYLTVPRCAEEAEKAAAEALKRDPALLEARLRLAAMRSERGEGVTDLVAIAVKVDAPPSFRYLAAIFAGKAAYARHDAAAAVDWFKKAATVDARWTIPLLLIAAVSNQAPPNAPLQTDAADPWYSYRCSVLTPTVNAELLKWIGDDAR